MNINFYRIRSLPLGDRRLATLLKGLEKRLGRGAIARHEAGNLESFTLLRDDLDALDMFNYLQSVVVSRHVGVGRSDREPYLGVIRDHRRGRSRMNLTLYGTEGEQSGPFNFRMSYGWQMEPSYDNFAHCQFEVAGNSPGVADLGYRRELFLRILDLIGLGGTVRVEWEGGELRVSADPGLGAIPIQAQLGGANPRGISISGFSGIDAAVDAAEQIIDQVLRRIDSTDFSVYVEGREGYEMIRPTLGALARGWEVGVGGGMSEAAGSVLAGAPSADAPGRVPAFLWQEKVGKEWYSPLTTYSGELVATASGYCLELSTDRGGMDRLLDYASEIKGLEFTPVK